MGYYDTTELGSAVAGKSCAIPKTHAPDSPVKERGNHLAIIDDARTQRSVTKYTRVHRKPHGGPIFNWVLSTKYTDSETGLVYYGYRFYMPETGRWCSRDPLGERGGRCLYNFCNNKSVHRIDPLGLASENSCCDGKPYDPKASCCYEKKIIPAVADSHTPYKVCCRPVEGFWGYFFKHCELRYGECSSKYGETEAYDVTKADSGEMDNGKPCRCATLGDLKDCAGVSQEPTDQVIIPGDRLGRHKGGYGPGEWGDNCQSTTVSQMSSCCMKSSWKPNFYAYPPPGADGSPWIVF